MPAIRRCEPGFALLVLLAVVGMGSLGVVLAVQSLVPPLAQVTTHIVANLGTVERASRDAFLRNGAFPVSLDALALASGLPADGPWRVDPWGNGQDLDYRLLATGPRIRSRGPDRRLGTADDTTVVVAAENQLRLRTNARLRLLRAVYLAALCDQVDAAGTSAGNVGPGRGAANRSNQGNAHGNGSGTGNGNGNAAATAAVSRTALRSALRTYATSQRAWWFADAAGRVALTTQMTAAAATIAAAQLSAAWGQPAALLGAGGLMERLGLPDALAIDGAGQALRLHPVLGFLATGSDGASGTDDDS